MIKLVILSGCILMGSAENTKHLSLPNLIANHQSGFDLTDWAKQYMDLTLTCGNQPIKMMAIMHEEVKRDEAKADEK